jgi:long-chain fatty acid transport protein
MKTAWSQGDPMKRFAYTAGTGLAFACLLIGGTAHAGGLYVSGFGNTNTATASAGAGASATNASTAIANPAGMTRLDGHQFSGNLAPGFTMIKFEADQQSPSGTGNGGDQGGFIPISSMNYVHKLTDDVGLGASLISVSGAAMNPADDWAGRFEMSNVSLFTLSLAPSIGIRVTDWLSIGGGALATYGKLELDIRTARPPMAGGGEPTVQLQDMTDWAGTGFGSILVEPCENFRFGVVYQGETTLNLSGDIKIPVGVNPALDLELPLPRAVRGNAFWDATDAVSLMMGAGWEDWSVAKNIPVSTTRGTANVPLNFRDTWYVAFGGHYKLNDLWTLKSGFRYDSSALKDKNRSVFLPIDRQLTVGVGGLYNYSESLDVGLAFSWTSLGSAPVNTSSVKGKYTRNDLFLFAVSLNWKNLPWDGLGTL